MPYEYYYMFFFTISIAIGIFLIYRLYGQYKYTIKENE